MKKTFKLLALVMLLSGFAFTSCGDDDEPETQTQTPSGNDKPNNQGNNNQGNENQGNENQGNENQGGEEKPVVEVVFIKPEVTKTFTDGLSVNSGIENYEEAKKAASFGGAGFCIAEKGKTPTIDDKSFKAQFNIAKGSFVTEIHDESLKNGDWTLRAYAEYGNTVVYSEAVDFSVIAFRTTISLSDIATIYDDGCVAQATISDIDNVEESLISESGFCVAAKGTEPTVNDITASAKPNVSGVLSANIHNDKIGVGTWTVRAYVKFDGQTFYSDAKDFTIKAIDYGFTVADRKFYYGDHTYEITEDFDPDNYDPVNKYDGNYYNYVKFSNIPSGYKEFEVVYKEFLGKHINGIIALQIMALEIYNRDRADGTKCFMLINQASDEKTILERVGHRYDNVNPAENQPYLAACFLQGANRKNFFAPTEPYTIKFQADPDGKKETSLTGRGDVFYVDVIAEGFESQKVKRCQVVLWEKNVIKGGYYEMHEWSSFVLTAPSIYGEDNSLWKGL